ELAPRDVVARAITREGMGTRPGETLPVYLDMRHVTSVDPDARFPGISAFLHHHGLDLARDLIPVRPAAHYLMGGVRTDVYGRTSLSGLYAAGEVACTGVHGANRLASNSLLEGLVFGARAAESMREVGPVERELVYPETKFTPMPLEDLPGRLRHLQAQMWEHAGLLRDVSGLRAQLRDLGRTGEQARPAAQRDSLELANLHVIAELIVRSALKREERRGAHYRNDFPQRDDEHFAKHSVVRELEVSFVADEPAQVAG